MNLSKKPPHTLFLNYMEATQRDLNNVLLDYEEDLVWLDEILEACKKALDTPEVELLPKTPSSRKPRSRIVRKPVIEESESDADDESITPPARKTRQTAKQKAAASKKENTVRTTRQTRGRKQNSESNEDPRQNITPKTKSNILSKMSDCSELELSDAEMTPVARSSNRLNLSKPNKAARSKYSVKQRASAYETMIDKRTSHSPNVSLTPVNKSTKLCTSMNQTSEQQLTPEQLSTPETVKVNRIVSYVEKENICNESVIKEKIAQKRRSSRKSLKVLASKVQRLSAHGHHISRQMVENDSSDINETIEEPKRKPRTRLRLQKKDAVEAGAKESEGTSVDQVSLETSSVDEPKETNSSYQSPVPIPKPRTSKNRTPIKSNSSLKNVSSEHEKIPQQERSSMETKPSANDVPSSSDNDVVMESKSDNEELQVRHSSGVNKASPNHDRDSGISGVLSAQTSAVSLKNLEVMDYEKSDGQRSTRSTRSKSKNYQSSPISEASEDNSVFIAPEEPKGNRKRQVDECEEVSPAPKSKRSCIGKQSDPEESKSDAIDDPETPVNEASDSDQYESLDNDSDEYTPPKCPKNKIIRPFGLSNSASRSATRPSYLLGMSTFLKRNTPVKPTKQSIDEKKREIMEKEKKNEDRVRRKKEMLNQKMQECRKQREERTRRAAELRMENERSVLNKQSENVKKFEERLTLKEQLKEEKLRGERLMKQSIRMQKQKEVLDRKNKEEEERFGKKLEQEEEDRRQREFLQKKREVEELERQRRLAEDQQRYEERIAEIERERNLEKDKFLHIELEREKETQRLKEDKEKQLAKEKAERERLELEKKKDREILIQKEMAKLRELEKARLARVAAEKEEEQLREKERTQKLLEKQQPVVTAKPTLNNTQNTTVNKSCDVNSYDITPSKKKYHDNSNKLNYNINDLHSDDSTDDEDKPRKRIPIWAQGTNLKAALINQEYHPPKLEVIFPKLPDLDLNDVFVKRKARFNKRTSSAVWDSPLLKPCQSAQFNV